MLEEMTALVKKFDSVVPSQSGGGMAVFIRIFLKNSKNTSCKLGETPKTHVKV